MVENWQEASSIGLAVEQISLRVLLHELIVGWHWTTAFRTELLVDWRSELELCSWSVAILLMCDDGGLTRHFFGIARITYLRQASNIDYLGGGRILN